MDGNTRCGECRQPPLPQGYEPTLKLCWFCAVPNKMLPLTDAQRELIQARWVKI